LQLIIVLYHLQLATEQVKITFSLEYACLTVFAAILHQTQEMVFQLFEEKKNN